MAADVIVVVKRIRDDLLATIRKSGKPWAYDIVDAYPQPTCSDWARDESLRWLRAHINRLQPDLVIWPNAQMQSDFGGGGVVAYHHHRPGIEINSVRERIETIGYEGSPDYIAEWMPAILRESQRRGWAFLINPPRLADVDIVLALRGKRFNGYPQKHWKSNIKLANAHGSGTPFIGADECSYRETAAGGEMFVESADQLHDAFDALEPAAVRRRISEQFLAASKRTDIASIAEEYSGCLRSKF